MDSAPKTECNTLPQKLSALHWHLRGMGWLTCPDYPIYLEPRYIPFTDTKSLSTDLNNLYLIRAQLRQLPRLETKQTPTLTKNISPSLVYPCTRSDELKVLRWMSPSDNTSALTTVHNLLLRTKYALHFPLSFELIAQKELVFIQLTCHKSDFSVLKSLLQLYCPRHIFKEVKDSLHGLYDPSNSTAIVEFGLTHEFIYPLPTPLSQTTDIINILQNLTPLQSGDQAIYQVLFQAAYSPWCENMSPTEVNVFSRPSYLDCHETITLVKEKLRNPLYAVVIRIAGQSTTQEQAWNITRILGGTLSYGNRSGNNALMPLYPHPLSPSQLHLDLIQRSSHRLGMLLNSKELANLIVFPKNNDHQKKDSHNKLKTQSGSKNHPKQILTHEIQPSQNKNTAKQDQSQTHKEMSYPLTQNQDSQPAKNDLTQRLQLQELFVNLIRHKGLHAEKHLSPDKSIIEIRVKNGQECLAIQLCNDPKNNLGTLRTTFEAGCSEMILCALNPHQIAPIKALIENKLHAEKKISILSPEEVLSRLNTLPDVEEISTVQGYRVKRRFKQNSAQELNPSVKSVLHQVIKKRPYKQSLQYIQNVPKEVIEGNP